MRTGATAAKCHRGPGRLPSGRGPNADRPFNELATSTARRIAAATWIMSSTTVASRAYAVVPAKRSRWSRGGAYRPRSAPAAGSARHRADAGRRDRAARSPDPQPASCGGRFGVAIVLAPRRALDTTGILGRTGGLSRAALVVMSLQELACQLLAPPVQFPFEFALAHLPGFVGGEEGFGIREDSIGRCTRGRARGIDSGDAGFAPLARRIYVPGILSSQPSQVCPPAHGTVPERRANVQKRARPRGTDRRCSAPFRGSAGRRKDAGTRWLGCCPPEMSTGETHPRAKRPMNGAKTPLRRRAAPVEEGLPEQLDRAAVPLPAFHGRLWSLRARRHVSRAI